MSKQMTRDEWNQYCQKKEPPKCRCDLGADNCPNKAALQWH